MKTKMPGYKAAKPKQMKQPKRPMKTKTPTGDPAKKMRGVKGGSVF